MPIDPSPEPPVCENDEAAMRLAIAEAEHAPAHGDVPVGAVAIVGGRDVAEAMGDWRMGGVTVVVTLEPCAMCAGAMVNGQVGRLVFGASDPRAGAVGSLYNLCTAPRLNHELP